MLPLLYRVREETLSGGGVQNWTETRVSGVEQQVEYGPVNAAFTVPSPLHGAPVLLAALLLVVAAVLVALGALLVGGGLVTALYRERPDLSRLAGEDEVVTSVGAFATTTHPLPPVDPVQSGWDTTRYAPGPSARALRGRAGGAGVVGGRGAAHDLRRGRDPRRHEERAVTHGFAAGFWVLCAAAVVAVLGAVLGAVLSQRRPVPEHRPAGADGAQDDGGVVVHDISGFDEDGPVFPERPASGAAG